MSHIPGRMTPEEIRLWSEEARKLHSQISEYVEKKEGLVFNVEDLPESVRKRIWGEARGWHLESSDAAFEKVLYTFNKYPESGYVCGRLAGWADKLIYHDLERYRDLRESQGDPLSEKEYEDLKSRAYPVVDQILNHAAAVLYASDHRRGLPITPKGGIE